MNKPFVTETWHAIVGKRAKTLKSAELYRTRKGVPIDNDIERWVLVEVRAYEYKELQ